MYDANGSIRGETMGFLLEFLEFGRERQKGRFRPRHVHLFSQASPFPNLGFDCSE